MQLAYRDDELYYNMLKWFHRNAPDKIDRYIESISPNQLKGKEWLMELLNEIHIPRDEEGKFKIEIIGGWFGFPLIDLLVLKYGEEIRGIDYFDPDPFAAQVFSVYLNMWDVDIQDVKIYTNKIGDYFEYKQKRRAHLVINTSCEHMQNMNAMKDYYFNNDRTLLVLQSNNKRDEPDHINCVDGCEELAEQAGITIKSGAQKTMKTRKQHGHEWDYYNRFMVLGKWE